MVGALLLKPDAVPRRLDDSHSYMGFWLEEMRVRTPGRAYEPLSHERVVASTVAKFGEHGTEDLFDSVGEKNVDALGLLDIGRVGGTDDTLVSDPPSRVSPGALILSPSPCDASSVGCVSAALRLSAFFDGPRFRGFADDDARRDGMLLIDEQTTSRLSPHIRFGELSPRFVFHASLTQARLRRARQLNKLP